MTDPVPDPGTDVAVYVHWPYCARICPYCDFNVVRDRRQTEQQAALVEAILIDLEMQAGQTGPQRLASIFFGGGTPSLMRPGDVARIIAAIRARFAAAGPVEITLEANPTNAESAHFAALAEAGVNRLSLGVQSLDDTELTAAFLLFDWGPTSGVPYTQIPQQLGLMGVPASDDAVMDRLLEVDTDLSGVLTYAQYKATVVGVQGKFF